MGVALHIVGVPLLIVEVALPIVEVALAIVGVELPVVGVAPLGATFNLLLHEHLAFCRMTSV